MDKLLYQFLEQGKRKKYRPNTINDYQRTISEFFTFIRDTYPDVTAITEITRDMIVSYEKYLVTRRTQFDKLMSRSRRKRYLYNLKNFFSYLEKEEHIFKNPTSNIAFPRERKPIIKDILTIEEMEKLLKSCSGNSIKELRDRALLELLYSTGMRAEELCSIEMKDLDLNERTVFIRQGKGSAERIVPFGNTAASWISRYMTKARSLINSAGSELVFVSMRGKKLQPQALCDIIKKCTTLSGIDKNVTTHTFRHSCASHMLKGGADIRYVQKLLGHRRISTTEKYLRVEITDLKEVHEKCHPREQDSWGDV